MRRLHGGGCSGCGMSRAVAPTTRTPWHHPPHRFSTTIAKDEHEAHPGM